MTQSLVSPALRQRVRGWATPIALGLGRLGLTPNALTVIGFAGTCVAAWAAATQQWLLAGALVLAFGMFDLFDGALARATGKTSRFGALLDSTLDRTGESLVLGGIAVGCAQADFVLGTGLAALALTFASGVTYTRAKAESLGLAGEIGLAPREVRLAVLGVGLVLSNPATTGATVLSTALGLIALLSAITIVQRIVHAKRQLDANEQENT